MQRWRLVQCPRLFRDICHARCNAGHCTPTAYRQLLSHHNRESTVQLKRITLPHEFKMTQLIVFSPWLIGFPTIRDVRYREKTYYVFGEFSYKQSKAFSVNVLFSRISLNSMGEVVITFFLYSPPLNLRLKQHRIKTE